MILEKNCHMTIQSTQKRKSTFTYPLSTVTLVSSTICTAAYAILAGSNQSSQVCSIVTEWFSPYPITITSHECHGISNHCQLAWLLDSLFILTTKKTSKLCYTCHVWGEFTGHHWCPLPKDPWFGKCFCVLISSWISINSLALGESYSCSTVSEVTLKNKYLWVMWVTVRHYWFR